MPHKREPESSLLVGDIEKVLSEVGEATREGQTLSELGYTPEQILERRVERARLGGRPRVLPEPEPGVIGRFLSSQARALAAGRETLGTELREGAGDVYETVKGMLSGEGMLFPEARIAIGGLRAVAAPVTALGRAAAESLVGGAEAVAGVERTEPRGTLTEILGIALPALVPGAPGAGKLLRKPPLTAARGVLADALQANQFAQETFQTSAAEAVRRGLLRAAEGGGYELTTEGKRLAVAPKTPIAALPETIAEPPTRVFEAPPIGGPGEVAQQVEQALRGEGGKIIRGPRPRAPGGAEVPTVETAGIPPTEPTVTRTPIIKPKEEGVILGKLEEAKVTNVVQDIAKNVGAVEIPPPPAGSPKLLNRAWSFMRELGHELSPSQFAVLTRSKDPAAIELGGEVRRLHIEKRAFLLGVRDEVSKAVKGLSSEERKQLGSLLDREVLPDEFARMKPEVATAYSRLRDLTEDLRIKGNIPPEKVIAHYFHHFFDRDEMFSFLQAKAQSLVPGSDEYASVQGRIKELLARQPVRFNQLSPNIQVSYLMERSGAKGFTLDPVRSFDHLAWEMGRKLYDEPARQVYHRLAPNIKDKQLLDHAEGLITRATTRRTLETQALERLDRGLRTAQFLDKLTINAKWTMVNLYGGQKMAFAELGPESWFQGGRWFRTPEGQKAFLDSGHMSQRLTEAFSGRQLPRNVESVASLFADRVEAINRGVTWLGELWRSYGREVGPEAFRRALATGSVPRQAILKADEAVELTQGLYGLANPAITERPVVRALTQFTLTPAKQLQTFLGWVKRNPAKAAVYIGLAEGFQETVRATTGIDTSYAFGIGIDVPELYDGLTKNEPMSKVLYKAVVRPWAEGRSGIFSIGTGPLIGLAKGGINLAGAIEDIIAGKTGAEARTIEKATQVSALASRFAGAKQAIETGGTAGEAIRRFVAIPAEATKVREAIIHQAKLGNRQNAIRIRGLYDMAHPGEPLQIDAGALLQAFEEGEVTRRGRAREAANVPLIERLIERQKSPTVRRALTPP